MKLIFHKWEIQLLVLLAITISSCTSGKPKYPDPLSPKKSIGTFHFAGDFKAEVFAAEPLVKDPVAMRFDDKGNAYVVEMGSANLPDSVKGRGRIVRLKDTNGDGQADQSTVFASGLTEPTSILPWKSGLIVTAAPNILYLKDTNGDGKSDNREVLFSGFFTDNEEAQITNLRFGVDNWIYANNDGQAGKVTYHRNPSAAPLSMQGADFRFRLDRGKFERTTGPGQFGQAFDDWGHRFFTKNSLHIQQVVMPGRYLKRNPSLPAAEERAVKNISDHDPRMYQLTPAPYWRKERTKRRNKKYNKHHLDRVEYAKDHFTGASGGTFYGGDGFPDKFYGSIFTGDVAGNLVHRDKLIPRNDEPFFVAKRGKAEQTREFLAATDSWFRPTSFTVSPEGYLYVTDMYRQHIETPVSIPEDLQADMDFTNGSQRGRIYRIMPKKAGAFKKKPVNLTSKKSSELVKLLSNPNRWWRLHAHKLLVERQDKMVIPAIKVLVSRSKDPRVRLQALYVLEGLDGLTAEIVKKAMTDSAAGVRENAAILSERFSGCLSQLEKMTGDSSARVAFQATLSLGVFSGKSVESALANAVEQYGQNPWFRTAILSSKTGSTIDLLNVLAQKDSFFQEVTPWKRTFLEDLSYVIGNRNTQVSSLLKLLSRSPFTQTERGKSACIKGLMNGLKKSKQISPALKKSLQSIEMDSVNGTEALLRHLNQLIANSSKK